MHLFAILQATAAATPDAVALVDQAGCPEWTYAEMLRRVQGVAAGLRELKVEVGDRVAVWEQNRPAYLELYFALAALGAVAVPLNTRLSEPETSAILADAEVSLLVLGAGAPAANFGVATCAVDALRRPAGVSATPAVEVEPDSTAHIYYTSGSTGRPKGVMLTHRNVVQHARWAVEELGLGPTDTWAHIAPMFHLADAWATFAITLAGGRHVMLPSFSPEAALALLDDAGVTLTNLVPTMLGRMVHHPDLRLRSYPALRLMLSGGAPISPDVVRKILAGFGCDYVQTYGMTETSPYLTLSLLRPHLRQLPPEEQLRYKCKTGRPFGRVELRVVDSTGAAVPADGVAIGEIQVRGETVTPGYWRQPEVTRAAFTADGYLHTGDLATIDAEGYVDIVDRLKDVILTGGETVYSIEIETVLLAHEHVLEVAVVGRADPDWGEVVVAAVVSTDGDRLDAADLDRHCRRVLAGYKCPRKYEFHTALPRLGSGKIAKRKLRDVAGGQSGRSSGP